jgi:aminoglycoside phosphotransferase (APT) family kinase protein
MALARHVSAENTPSAEVDVDVALVRALLLDQLPDLRPDLAELDIVAVGSGWDNTIFRLGDELTVRLPRRAASAQLIENEQRWLPTLAPKLPLPIPAPVATGRPGLGFPWCWSVGPWLPGDSAADTPPADLEATARTLAGFLRALHQPAPPGAPANPVRGVLLRNRAERLHANVDQVAGTIDAPRVLDRWARLVETPPSTGPPLWLHGDLRSANLLVHHGKLSAVIDFGDITAGDPATDLAIAWMLFPPAARAAFLAALDTDDATWARGQGWALALGVAYVANSANDAYLAREGRAVIDSVLADPLA